MAVVSIYLILEFGVKSMRNTWLVWAVGGIVFGILMIVIDAVWKKEKK